MRKPCNKQGSALQQQSRQRRLHNVSVQTAAFKRQYQIAFWILTFTFVGSVACAQHGTIHIEEMTSSTTTAPNP